MNLWLGPRMKSCLLLLCLPLFACSALGGEQDTEGPLTLTVIGGVVIPEEGPPREGGFALEGEDLVSPGPTITVRAGEPVTITFKVVDEIVPEPHDFVIVSEKTAPRPTGFVVSLWEAKTDRLRFGEEQTITFTPDTPGSYFYICSVTDHVYRGMWGSFIVEE